MTIGTWVKKTCSIFRQGKIFFGVDPSRIPAPALILFPLSPHTFLCGLAGILAIRKAPPPADEGIQEGLKRLYEEISTKDLKALTEGRFPPEDYLAGDEALERLDTFIGRLKGNGELETLFFSPRIKKQLEKVSAGLKELIVREEGLLEGRAGNFSTALLEIITGRLIILKDAAWALEKDILDNIDRIAALSGGDLDSELSRGAFRKYQQINFLLNAIDRLEVRGRDSAGLQVSFLLNPAGPAEVTNRLAQRGCQDDYLARSRGGELANYSITLGPCPGSGTPAIHVTFTYKTSSIVGELGRNVRELRRFISRDPVLYEFASLPAEGETVMAHTRWASVGTITDSNCHPVNNFSLPGSGEGEAGSLRHYPRYGRGNWSINVALNGDIDNYQALRDSLEATEVFVSPELTTDTKIVPLIVEKYLLAGADLPEAFRLALNDFEGSHAIAMTSNLEPHRAYLALKGSGQSLYIGVAPDRYIFASEVYGLVEGTRQFLRMDGEDTAGSKGNGQEGQIFILDQESKGGPGGIQACYYDGTPLALTEKDLKKAEITTRDIDRGHYPHFFLKEIGESAESVRKTLRGRYVISEAAGRDTQVNFNLGRDVIPAELEQSLLKGQIRQILVIGHGTAAVAGCAVADGFKRYLVGTSLLIEAKVASELSGFSLQHDLQDTLLIPITQSGTTTDTNRAVAMARERGAIVLAIVNRRQSDITGKSQGVFYTSDGRDIEMSVASTKAFYSQIVAGHVLALRIAQLLGSRSEDFIARELRQLEEAPELMRQVLARREEIGRSARDLVRQRTHWAVVGSGPNKAAAEEIRIKLSELCYKTISADVVENKKHIDLSAEPLVIVCAAGIPESVTADVVKDVAIFKAHKSAVVVFAEEGEERFNGIADSIIHVPAAPLPLSVILNTLAGHLWGYYAACAIDEDALFLREFRGRLNLAMEEQDKENLSLYERLSDRNLKRLIRDFTEHFQEWRNKGAFSFSHVKTITDLVLLLKYAAGKLPLEDFWSEFSAKRRGASPVDYLDLTLGHAVDELSRPIDAIRHQAKTVTVGTSRKEEPLRGPVFDLLKELGFTSRSITSKNMMIMERIHLAIEAIRGYTLYEIENLDEDGNPREATRIMVGKRGGISLEMRSRADTARELMGTKRTIVSTGRIWVGHGKFDGAPLLILPLFNGSAVVKHILLLHVIFNESLPLEEKKALLGYRLSDIHNLVNEYNLTWEDRYLNLVPLGFLLGEPVET
ncbi:MAG: SIS domain-containing protein, partial [Smithellaceae bacterium]|nr:SIS domain-containing protein [Smithellaceae bacterium]